MKVTSRNTTLYQQQQLPQKKPAEEIQFKNNQQQK